MQIETIKKNLHNELQYYIFEKNNFAILQSLIKILNLDQNDINLRNLKAKTHFQLQQYNQCIKECQISLKLQSKQIIISNMLIKSYLEIQCLQEAQNIIKQLMNQQQNISEFIKLYETVLKIKKGFKQYKLNQNEQKIIQNMKQKLYMVGSNYDKLKIGYIQNIGYRGVFVTKTIKKDQKIIFIPRSHMITLEMAKQNRFCIELLINKIQLLSPKHTYLSIFLLEQLRNCNSEWKFYLQILPQDHSCFPINYNYSELNQLIGSSFLFQIKEKVLDLKKDYQLIIQNCRQFGQYSFKQFCWARMIIGSRIFGLVIDGNKTEALVPFADMLNHKLPKQTVWNYSSQSKGFYIKSLQEINVGEQIFDSYGKKCNSRFLLNYGFLLSDNDKNQVCFRVTLDQQVVFRAKKKAMLKEESSQEVKIFRVCQSLDEAQFFQLMGFLRFKNINEIQTIQTLEKISGIKDNNQPYRPSRTPPISNEIEIRSWKQLEKMCKQNIKAYPTSLKTDYELIKNKEISQNIKNILILRIGEKKIFLQIIQACHDVIQLLGKGYLYAKQIVQKDLSKSHYIYLNKILSMMPKEKKEKSKLEMMKKNNQKNHHLQEEEEENYEQICMQ